MRQRLHSLQAGEGERAAAGTLTPSDGAGVVLEEEVHRIVELEHAVRICGKGRGAGVGVHTCTQQRSEQVSSRARTGSPAACSCCRCRGASCAPFIQSSCLNSWLHVYLVWSAHMRGLLSQTAGCRCCMFGPDRNATRQQLQAAALTASCHSCPASSLCKVTPFIELGQLVCC
jgi:hypothetical protein